jgi:hypothetical protein
MHLSSYLGLLETGCATLAKSYRQVAKGHAEEGLLRPFTERYGSHPSGEPERLRRRAFQDA